MSHETWLLGLMLAAFLGLVAALKWPVGLSLALTSTVVAAADGHGFPLRHLVEGMFGYLDVSLVLITAMIFMKVIEKNGLLDALTCDLMLRFGRSPATMLTVMTLIIMFPGMITGSCTASVLSTGVLLVPVLLKMNMPKEKAGAIVAMAAVYGMIAPPVNIVVMIIGGGIDMPYIGFDLPLLYMTLPLAVLTTLYLGYGYARRADMGVVMEEFACRERAPGGFLLYLPLLAVVVLMIGPKALPEIFPDPRLPLTFVIGTAMALFSGRKFNLLEAAQKGVSEILSVVGILMGVGMLIQIMTLTGIRGNIAVSSLSLPYLLLAGIAVTLPLFGGISVFGAASVLGVPFILTMLGQNLIITASGMSLIAAMGSFMPPVALTAVIAAQVVNEPDYLKIVKPLILPSLVAIGIGVLMIKYATQIARIVL